MVLTLFSLIFTFTAHADIQSSEVTHLPAILKILPTQTKLPVVFAKALPLSERTYFASVNLTQFSYDIFIDATANCAGKKYCNVLTFHVEKSEALPTFYKNRQNETMTQVISETGQDFYYTQGFALGDYWNPQIAWQSSGILYSIVWKGLPDAAKTKEALLKLALEFMV